MDPLQPGRLPAKEDAPLTMPHERLRLEQLLQDASGRADSESAKPADIRQAMIHSWNVLSTAGYTRFGSVAALRPADFAARIKATEPDMSRPISMALDVIARHQFNHLEGAPDKSVQFLQRAHLLSPDDVRIACHFADVTILLQDEHLSRIADPNIRTTTLRGYRSTAQDAILQTLKNQFGITEGIVRGSSPTTIESCVEHQSQEHKDHAYTLLGKLAILSNLSGTEKERLGLLNLSLSASYSQFALLGHGRNISLIVADLIDRLGNCQDDAEVRNLLQEKSPGILDILGQLGTTTWNKGKLLGAQLKVTTHRPTRLAMQNEQMLMHTLSEDIDAILDLLEPIS